MDFNVSVKSNFSPAAIEKNINFGVAKALTGIATDIQREIQYKIKSTFTIRKNWFEQQTPLGIKKIAATPQSLKASVYTNAYFLPLQDEGGTRIPYKNWLAIPTTNVRPTKAALIPKALLPGNLKNAFEITSKKGVHLLCVRGSAGYTARGSRLLNAKQSRKMGVSPDLLVMYILVKRAAIRKTGVFIETATYYANRFLARRIQQEIQYALDNIREVSA